MFVWNVSAILYTRYVFVWCAHELNETTTAIATKQRKIQEITTNNGKKIPKCSKKNCERFIENQPNKALHQNESNENSRVVGIFLPRMSAHFK